MLKVFQLISSIQLGGAEIVAFNLSEFCNYPQKKFEFIVVELQQTDDEYSKNKKKELNSKNISFKSLGPKSKTLSLLFGHFALAYQILKEKPDIIHSHTDLPDLVLSNTKRIFSFFHLKFPVIVRTIHNTVLWPTHNLLGKYVEKAYVDDWIIGVSEQSLVAYEELRLKYKLKVSDQKRTIYNGCNVPKIREHSFKIDPGKINIAFCGRFEHQKGIDVLIERIKAINSKFKNDFLFHIIGSGTYLNEVLKATNENENVVVYEAVSNIADKLYAFDFLIMPSRFEGLVLVSIEASFSKVPVIVAIAKGLSETLPPDWPLQFHLDNEDELLAIFENIRSHNYDLIQLKEQAYSFVSEKFSLNEMIDGYSRLYLDAYQ
ncbi:MAG: glycosyltransferase family 4 protein [Paludibacter sp.]|nr:glycosyltransferase family 4 protein [Paludibacter sp.]